VPLYAFNELNYKNKKIKKKKILSWYVRGLNERDKRLRIGRLIMFVYKKLNWSIFLGLWCAVYGFVNMWISVFWGRKGLLEGFS
jgi:hypothetical protein